MNFQVPVAVWNHHFRFQVDLSLAQVLTLRLQLVDESYFPVQEEIVSVQLELRSWESLVGVCKSQSIKCVPMQNAAPTGDNRPSIAPQLLLACFWSPGGEGDGGDAPENGTKEVQYADAAREESTELQSSSLATRQSLSLGDALNLMITGICRIPSNVFEKMTASGKSSEIVVRGRLLPNGGTSRAIFPLQSAQVDANHCGNSTAGACIRFPGDASSSAAPSLSFELSPSVFDALQVGTNALRVEVEIRSKRLRDWSLSFCVGLASFIDGGGSEAQDWPFQLNLLDEAENFAGAICTAISVLAGDSSCKVSSPLRQIQLAKSSTRVKLQIQDLKPLNIQTSSCPHVFVKLWSSSIGRQRAFKSPAMPWDTSGLKPPSHQPTQAALVYETEITTESAATEVFFVELCRFSHRERNEVLGSCSFSLTPDLLLLGLQSNATSTDGGTRVEKKRISLSTSNQTNASSKNSGSTLTVGNEICGEMLIVTQILATPSLTSSPSSLETKVASSILSDVKYTSPTGGQPESRGVLEVDVVDAYPPPSLESASSGDSMRLHLQMLSSSQWNELSSLQEIVEINARGDRKVSWNESFTSPSVSWSSKDRFVPALRLKLIACSKQRSLEAIGKKPQLPQSSSSASRPSSRPLNTTKSIDKRDLRPTKPAGDSGESERCLGVYTLDLCALFSQPSCSPMCLLLLVPVDSSDGNASGSDERVENEQSGSLKIPLLVTIRLVTGMQAPASLLTASVTSKARPVQVNGEVCLHIRTASGGFLRRGAMEADQYFVSAGFGSKSVSTRYVNR